MHKISGRTRVRIPARRGDHSYFRHLTEQLEAMEGVHEVHANPVTGSVLIHHEEDYTRLMQRVREIRLFHLIPPEVEEATPNLALDLARKLENVDQRIREITANRVDLTGAAIVALVGAGIFQLLRGEFLPAGGSLLWYAFGLTWLKPKTPPMGPI